jgi:hypothetical protein
MLVVSVWLKWHKRDVSQLLLIAALLLPLVLGPLAERVLHRVEHGARQDSILPSILLGKAAMLMRADTTFSGPHAPLLGELGRVVLLTYKPVHEFLAGLPSLAAYPVLTAGYEGAAQFSVFEREIAEAAARSGWPGEQIASELGKQAILGNLIGYVRLSLVHYMGQWSITALRFPSVAKTVRAYVANYPDVPFEDVMGDVFLRPSSQWQAVVLYPSFLLAGAIALVLAFVIVLFLIRPRLADSGNARYLMLAAFFAASAHSYTFLLSFVATSTPRFLMAVYPQVVVAGVFLVMPMLRRLGRDAAGPAVSSVGPQ